MKQRTIGRIGSVMVILWMVLLTLAGSPAARARGVPLSSPHCGGWNIIPSPNPTDYMNELSAVAAVSASDVWAVGESEAIRGPQAPLIENWDGTQWTVVASPNPSGNDFLNGVAAVSATNVWAVGGVGGFGQGTLIEHWDSTSWQVVASPSVDGTFYGISVQSANDIWAVGGQLGNTTLTEHWNGTSWQVVASPNVPNYANHLYGVSAYSATDVWAVGNASIYRGPSNTLIEHWNGQQWSIVPSPNGSKGKHRVNGLSSVAALSAQNVWAVGGTETSTLNEQWNGSTWSVVSPSPTGSANGIVAVTPTDIWAVGDVLVNYAYDTFTEHWNGRGWQQVASPSVTATTISPSYYNNLNGVSASSAHDIWAVGYVRTYLGDATFTLIEHYC